MVFFVTFVVKVEIVSYILAGDILCLLLFLLWKFICIAYIACPISLFSLDMNKIQNCIVDSTRESRKQVNHYANNRVSHHNNKEKYLGIPNSWKLKHDLLKQVSRPR